MGTISDVSLNGGVEQNLAVWLTGAHKLEVKQYSLPSKIGDRDAKIRMKAVGICGSDMSYLKHMCCGEATVTDPMVMGHECAGVVEEVGSSVGHLAVGDRVALEPGIACGLCALCKGGLYNLCEKMSFFATPPVHGCLAEQVIHPADLCFKLPKYVSLEEGAMCEPLSVAIHSCRRAGVGADTTVMVWGAGPIGILCVLTAKAFGSPRVVIADVHKEKLALAKELGADDILLVSRDGKDTAKEVKNVQDVMGSYINVFLDCVGLEKTMSIGLRATGPGGKVVAVGMREACMKLPIVPASCKEVDLLGSFRYRNTYPLCLKLMETGKVDVKPLITNRFGFSQKDVINAFKVGMTDQTSVKVMFNL